MQRLNLVVTIAAAALSVSAQTRVAGVHDLGIVLEHGKCPKGCDSLGARDVWVYRSGGSFVMNYDAAGANGWFAAQARSTDGKHWTPSGDVLAAGATGRPDSASASYGTVFHNPETGKYDMYYLGTPHVSDSVNKIPAFPYSTLYAESSSPLGPWVKNYARQPFTTKAGTYYSVTASPGQIIREGEQDYMFFSAATVDAHGVTKRTIGLARSLHGEDWKVDSSPILPNDEQIENSSIYYQNGMWYLFTNHVKDGLYTDSIVMYWSHDLTTWHAEKKAVVLDSANLHVKCIGLPSVTVVGSKLYVYYDTPGGDSISHMGRNIGLAVVDLPLRVRYY